MCIRDSNYWTTACHFLIWTENTVSLLGLYKWMRIKMHKVMRTFIIVYDLVKRNCALLKYVTYYPLDEIIIWVISNKRSSRKLGVSSKEVLFCRRVVAHNGKTYWIQLEKKGSRNRYVVKSRALRAIIHFYWMENVRECRWITVSMAKSWKKLNRRRTESSENMHYDVPVLHHR